LRLSSQLFLTLVAVLVSSAYPLTIVFASRLLRYYGAFLDLTEVFSVTSRPSTISKLGDGI
jgi:hypothetical protein